MEILKADKLDSIIRELNLKETISDKYEDSELSRFSMYVNALNQLESGDLKIDASLTEGDFFYSRYYWFTQFKKRYFMLYGNDASLEERSIQMWEYYYLSHSDIDWKLLEQIENGSI